MNYGSNIGEKFYEDGSVRRYPGNTCVAAIEPNTKAFDLLSKLHDMLFQSPLQDHYIPLPKGSYHMTLLSGLNDQKRMASNWPEALSPTVSMEEADDYVEKAFLSAKLPGRVKMRFREVSLGKSCFLVKLDPVDEETKRILLSFRERGAEAVGLYLPNHQNYTFHVSLAYTRIIPEGEDAKVLEELKAKMNALLKDAREFETGEPYMAFYDDMLTFHPHRIPR